MSRLDYRNKHLPCVLDSIRVKVQNIDNANFNANSVYIVPEGGSNRLGMLGVASLINQLLSLNYDFDLLCAPVGSGGTLSGVVKGAGKIPVLGFSALKNAYDLDDRVNALLHLNERKQFNICHDFHLGGFGKVPAPLKQFLFRFEAIFGIPLEPVYTAKMVLGIICKLLVGEISTNCRIAVLHTGGLQGSRSLLGDK